jgi:glycosyltransferase involved in cell wall biosynthesis
MAAGVPCLASTNAGATEDLIIEGVTGFKVNFENTLAIVEKVNWVLNQPEEMKKIGSTAKTFIGSNYSLSKCAENMISIF